MGRRELFNTKASPREGEETAANPLPPIQCATHPIGHPQGGLLSITLYFSNAGNASAAIFWWFLASAVVLRNGFSASAGASAGIRACVGRYVNQNGCFSGPCLATLDLACDVAASQKSQGLVTIHPDLNFPPRNLLSKLISFETWCVLGPSFVWGYLSSANVCNFIHDRGVSDSIEISWLRYHVKTRARRGSSFSQLGLEPNHTGWTAQSLFFLEESCRVKRSDTQTFSNFSNYFKRVLKL